MAYTKTTWVDGDNRYDIKTQASAVISADVKLIYVGTPAGTAISQTVMNNIEDGIYNAHVTLETASNVGTATATAEVISLASTALEAPFSTAYLRGRTEVNVLKNGNFVNGDYWSPVAGAESVASNVYTLTGDGSSVNVSTGNVMTGITLVEGHKYFISVNARVTNAVSELIYAQAVSNSDEYIANVAVQASPSNGTWYKLSGIVTIGAQTGDLKFSITHRYADAGAANGKVMEIKEVMVINLTARYGAGNEPTEANARLAYPQWFDDIKGSNKMRVLSVGKNFLKEEWILGSYINIGSGAVEADADSFYDPNYYKIDANTDYNYLQTDTKNTYFYFYDIAKNYISYTNTALNDDTITMPVNCKYFRIGGINTSYTSVLDITQRMVEKGTVATVYESFKSTSAIVPAIGNSVSDTIYDKVDLLTGRKEKNVSDITSIATTVYADIDKSSFSLVDIVFTTAFTLAPSGTTGIDAKTRVFDKNNKELEEVTLANVNLTASVGKYYYHTDNTIWFIVAADIYANVGEARTALGTSQIVYQLAEPIPTNGYANVLNSYPSGTIIVSLEIEDKGIYGSNLAITDTDYPISSLVEVWKVNTDDTKTPIAISDCTISAGLTFTISGAVIGEYYKYIYGYAGLSSTPSTTYDTADSTKAVEDNLCMAVANLDEKIEDVETAIDADITGIRTKLERYGASSAGSDTYAVTNTYPTKALYAGMTQTFKADVANTGASTLNVDGLGAKDLKVMLSGGKTATATGNILANGFYTVIYDGTDFVLVNPTSILNNDGTFTVSGQTLTASNTYTKTIALGATFTKGYMILRGDEQYMSAIVFFDTTSNNTMSMGTSFATPITTTIVKNKGIDGIVTAQLFGVTGTNYIIINSCYINGTNLEIEFKNIGVGSDDITVDSAYWYVQA